MTAFELGKLAGESMLRKDAGAVGREEPRVAGW